MKRYTQIGPCSGNRRWADTLSLCLSPIPPEQHITNRPGEQIKHFLQRSSSPSSSSASSRDRPGAFHFITPPADHQQRGPNRLDLRERKSETSSIKRGSSVLEIFVDYLLQLVQLLLTLHQDLLNWIILGCLAGMRCAKSIHHTNPNICHAIASQLTETRTEQRQTRQQSPGVNLKFPKLISLVWSWARRRRWKTVDDNTRVWIVCEFVYGHWLKATL